MASTLNWGIIATGTIAHTFARGVLRSKTGKLVAVSSRTKSSAEKFGDEFNIAKRYSSHDELLADPNVQAVYIATPHPQHPLLAIKACEATKHVLCEKPIALNHAGASAVIEAAIANDVFLMEAYMYRCHPQTDKLVELIKNGAVGQVRMINASFSFHWPIDWDPTSRAVEQASAGGGILDVGCYPVSASRLIAGAAMGKPFAEPIDVKGVAHLGRTGVDEWAVAVARFENNIVAQWSCAVQVNQEWKLEIWGSEGSINVVNPWIPARDGGATKIIVNRRGKEPQEVIVESPEYLYGIEADHVARCIDQRQCPKMSWADTLGNMKALDRWRDQIGLVYDEEKPAGFRRTTISGRPLAMNANRMKYGSVKGLEKKVSRLIMGVDNQDTLPQAAIMFDDFFEKGGNTFDTAYIYGRNGEREKLLGQWIKLRGVRDQVNLIVKGAHTPFCTPKDLSRQFKESLERLQIDHADVYLMHRDNLDLPVGEFVDVLNEHHRAGRMTVFGGSNWTMARIDEANAYAEKRSLTPFSVISNNFSLARMINPIWAGCISASTPDWREWLARTQTALFSWSSQARGFFVPGLAHPEKRDNAEMVHTWYSDDNFQRLERAKELAAKKNIDTMQIALAYVLHQPFPTFALIGPRQLSETRTSLPGLDVQLTDDEVKWLNLQG